LCSLMVLLVLLILESVLRSLNISSRANFSRINLSYLWLMILIKQNKWIGWFTCPMKDQSKLQWAQRTSSPSLTHKLFRILNKWSNWAKKMNRKHYPLQSMMMKKQKHNKTLTWDWRRTNKKMKKHQKRIKKKESKLLRMKNNK
jgi:hypothetical protein